MLTMTTAVAAAMYATWIGISLRSIDKKLTALDSKMCRHEHDEDGEVMFKAHLEPDAVVSRELRP